MFRIFVNLHRNRRRNLYLCVTWSVTVVLVLHNWSYSKGNVHQDTMLFHESVVVGHRGLYSVSEHISKPKIYSRNDTTKNIGMLQFTGVYMPLKPGKLGVVNTHLWFDLCGTNILTMKRCPSFPNIPSSRKEIPGLDMKNLAQNYGKRVFGFIIAPRGARRFVSFRLKASGSAEFWLSTDDKPANSNCLASMKTKTTMITTQYVKLRGTQAYYFEILHKHGAHESSEGNDYLRLEWKMNKTYQAIPVMNLKSYQDDDDIIDGAVNVQSFPLKGQQMHRETDNLNAQSLRISTENIYKLPFIPEETIKDLFPECEYKPDYLVTHKLERYGSEWETIYLSLFPSDGTDVTNSRGLKKFGNNVLEKSIAHDIVGKVLRQFRKKGLRHFSLESIINIEAKRRRYLVELELLDDHTNKTVRFSEYLYLPKNSDSLCYPKGFKWNKKAMVNFIVTSGGNQGKWIYHFIQNMEKIHKETKDDNFNVIISDFQSQDIDIKQVLENSSLPNYAFLSNTGQFHKTFGLQQAADTITDPNGIVAILDLHLDLPSSYVDDIRKHTIQELQVFSPILARMECGTNAAVDMGSSWEIRGYGLVGAYKQDWKTFGGMNVEEFKDKWGGEDVEMMDRILMARFEADRKKVKGLVHYYHSKRGMWKKIQNKNRVL